MGATLETRQDIRGLYGEPGGLAVKKQLPRLDPHARHFIALSPLVVLATADADGNCDSTPRGDAPGFVAVLDDRTLLLPDRRGNNRVDSLLNIAENPRVGLLFLVPGINETLRVNGGATITTDPALLTPLAMEGKTPTSGLLITVEEMYFHCGKALIRSKLWDATRHVPRKSFPTLGKIILDQSGGGDVEEADRNLEEAYKARLY